LWAKKDENTNYLNYFMWQPLEKIIIAASKEAEFFLSSRGSKMENWTWNL